MNDQVVGQKKWWANAILVGAVIGIVLLLAAPLGYRLGVFDIQGAISAMGLGTILAVIAFFLGIIALVIAMRNQLLAERSTVAVGLVVSGIVLAVTGSQFMAATSVPQIHNITTNTEEPPQFDKIAEIRESANVPNPHTYNAEQPASVQAAAYPDVQPLVSALSEADMLVKAEQALRDLGLEVVDVNAAEGRLEATATTFWFGYKDDVVVRVKPQGSGSVVDIRSVSRVGQSDLGANAARILAILDQLR